jgi:hypothetical protein
VALARIEANALTSWITRAPALAPALQHLIVMPTPPPRIPRSYDEIVRRTVPDPDSSFRPDERQVAEADARFRDQRLSAQMTDQERALYGRVAEVVFATADEIGFEVDRGTVILHGSVRDPRSIRRIEDRVREIDGVDHVDNRLVVAP